MRRALLIQIMWDCPSPCYPNRCTIKPHHSINIRLLIILTLVNVTVLVILTLYNGVCVILTRSLCYPNSTMEPMQLA